LRDGKPWLVVGLFDFIGEVVRVLDVSHVAFSDSHVAFSDEQRPFVAERSGTCNAPSHIDIYSVMP